MNEFEEIILNGFIIYLKEDKIVVRKEASKINSLVLEEKFYKTFQEAVQTIKDILLEQTPKEWITIVRYNRGLGIEYRNLPNIFACSKEDAEQQANVLAKQILDSKSKIIEIKLKPKIIQ